MKFNKKLNKKNFWKPFLIFLISSILLYFFGFNYLFYLGVKLSSGGNAGHFFEYLKLSLYILPFIIFILSIPIIFVIRRLLTKKPKKVFYIELPILIVIYSVVIFINQIFGLMIGGPMGMSTLDILFLILPQIIFVIIWLVLLTISLYFYYKKSKIISPKNL